MLGPVSAPAANLVHMEPVDHLTLGLNPETSCKFQPKMASSVVPLTDPEKPCRPEPGQPPGRGPSFVVRSEQILCISLTYHQFCQTSLIESDHGFIWLSSN